MNARPAESSIAGKPTSSSKCVSEPYTMATSRKNAPGMRKTFASSFMAWLLAHCRLVGGAGPCRVVVDRGHLRVVQVERGTLRTDTRDPVSYTHLRAHETKANLV